MAIGRLTDSLVARIVVLAVVVGSIFGAARIVQSEDPCRHGTIIVDQEALPSWTFAEIVQRAQFVAIVELRSAEFTPVLGPLLLDGKTHAIGTPYTTFEAVVHRVFVGDERPGDVARIAQEGATGYCFDPPLPALMTVGERYLVTSMVRHGRPGEYVLFPYDRGYLGIDSTEQEADLVARVKAILMSKGYARPHPSRT